MEKEKILIITGPTAVGKTDLSIDLAKRFKGEVISADSMQIYKGMDIGTAKVREEEMQGIPHHLIDIVEPNVEYTVSDFKSDASGIISDLNKKGSLPIVVGGTGLYINSLIYNLNFTRVEANQEIRDKYEDYALNFGNDALHDKLKRLDPKSAEKLHPNDVKRVVRALEIYDLTGRPMSETSPNFREKNNKYDFYLLGLYRNRKKLYERIDYRVDLMIEAGLIEEVEGLLSMGYDEDLVSMAAIGYKEVVDYIKSRTSYETMLETLKRNSRRYAKRQLTWFRREEDVHWVDVEDFNQLELIDDIEKNLKL